MLNAVMRLLVSPPPAAHREAMSSNSGLCWRRSALISAMQASGPRSSNSREIRSLVSSVTRGNTLIDGHPLFARAPVIAGKIMRRHRDSAAFSWGRIVGVAEPRRVVPSPSVGSHRDALCAALCLCRLRDRHVQDAALEVRLSGVRVDAVRQGHNTLDATEASLMQNIAILIDFTIGLFLTTDDQHAVAHSDVDVRLVHSWQFRRDLHLLVGFGDVDLDA